MWHFVWVFSVCQSLHLGVTSIQRVGNKYDQDVPCIYSYPVENKVFDFGLSLHLLSKIVNEFDQEIPQSQTADNPMAPRGRVAQPG